MLSHAITVAYFESILISWYKNWKKKNSQWKFRTGRALVGAPRLDPPLLPANHNIPKNRASLSKIINAIDTVFIHELQNMRWKLGAGIQ